MAVVLAVVVVLGLLLLWATYAEDVAPEPRRQVLPRWADLPTAADIRRADFPLAPVGYDRAVVEAHLARVAHAYEVLLTARDHVEGQAEEAALPDLPPTGVVPAGEVQVGEPLPEGEEDGSEVEASWPPPDPEAEDLSA